MLVTWTLAVLAADDVYARQTQRVTGHAAARSSTALIVIRASCAAPTATTAARNEADLICPLAPSGRRTEPGAFSQRARAAAQSIDAVSRVCRA
jgi:hypothetical protein